MAETVAPEPAMAVGKGTEELTKDKVPAAMLAVELDEETL